MRSRRAPSPTSWSSWREWRPSGSKKTSSASGPCWRSSGALEVYVLPPASGAQLIEARERAFFVGKAAGCDDLIDAVMPRAAIPDYLARLAALAQEQGALVTGCGHIGDGNVHISVFQPDDDRRHALLRASFELALAAGGAISGEHGIGTAKQEYFLELEDPVALELMRSIKQAFDPRGILGPDRLLGAAPRGATAR